MNSDEETKKQFLRKIDFENRRLASNAPDLKINSFGLNSAKVNNYNIMIKLVQEFGNTTSSKLSTLSFNYNTENHNDEKFKENNNGEENQEKSQVKEEGDTKMKAIHEASFNDGKRGDDVWLVNSFNSNTPALKTHIKQRSCAFFDFFNKSKGNRHKSNDANWRIVESDTSSTFSKSSQDHPTLNESLKTYTFKNKMEKRQKYAINIACAVGFNLTRSTVDLAYPPLNSSTTRNNLVILQIVNLTGYTIRFAEWPTEFAKEGVVSYRPLSRFRGSFFVSSSIPQSTNCLGNKVFQIGVIDRSRIKKSTIKTTKAHFGWIYFDIIKKNGYILHLQCFVKLNRRSGKVSQALLGKFDLDSCQKNPMPKGCIGLPNLFESFSFSFSPTNTNCNNGGAIISFILRNKDVENERNLVHHAPLKPILGLAAKRLTFYSYVSHPKLILTYRAGKDGRYHEGQSNDGFIEKTKLQKNIHNSSDFIRSDHILEGIMENICAILCVQHFNFQQPLIYPSALKCIALYPIHSWLDLPFSKLVLPGSHDAGMFAKLHSGGNRLIDHGIPFIHVLTRVLKTFNIELDRAIGNIANTQKDNIYDQLRLGARFFDFRPGYCVHDCMNGHLGEIHHQHACVPGEKYVTALEDTFIFLATHPREIVVFELKSDGFIAKKTTPRKDSTLFYSMIPNREALAAAMDEARSNVACQHPDINSIKVGGAADLDRKIGDLIDDGTRFLVINRMGARPDSGWEWERDDSYDDNLYDTDRSEEIIRALNKTHARNSIPKKYDILRESAVLRGTIYQLQATPTKSIADNIITSLTYSDASSLLVYTKANVDPHTYTWVREKNFIEPGLVVLLNDFVDSALTERAIEKSQLRAGFF
ncbi:hypothetical protein O181_006305 [Austropuccinia psidii MF-1]|uniref:Uncharacterized protein n=1 Tax=Austropuccinia psidii MF-1 TaxID=1389203 RepID=A0A9Q3BKS4_9BASI|nr:hypothetical protein [Austropuccinia psidii MF-1]